MASASSPNPASSPARPAGSHGVSTSTADSAAVSHTSREIEPNSAPSGPCSTPRARRRRRTGHARHGARDQVLEGPQAVAGPEARDRRGQQRERRARARRPAHARVGDDQQADAGADQRAAGGAAPAARGGGVAGRAGAQRERDRDRRQRRRRGRAPAPGGSRKIAGVAAATSSAVDRVPAAPDQQRAAGPGHGQQPGDEAAEPERRRGQRDERERAERQRERWRASVEQPARTAEVAAAQAPLQRERERERDAQALLDDAARRGRRPAAPPTARSRAPWRRTPCLEHDARARPRRRGLRRGWQRLGGRGRHQPAPGVERALRRDARPRLEHDGGLEHVLRLAAEPRPDEAARALELGALMPPPAAASRSSRAAGRGSRRRTPPR